MKFILLAIVLLAVTRVHSQGCDGYSCGGGAAVSKHSLTAAPSGQAVPGLGAPHVVGGPLNAAPFKVRVAQAPKLAVNCVKRVASRWSYWGGWSACSNKCGAGTQTRKRSCVRGDDCSGPCVGPSVQTRPCVSKIQSAYWQQWNFWSKCSTTCGVGTQIRTRTCITNICSKTCVGPSRQVRPCGAPAVGCRPAVKVAAAPVAVAAAPVAVAAAPVAVAAAPVAVAAAPAAVAAAPVAVAAAPVAVAAAPAAVAAAPVAVAAAPAAVAAAPVAVAAAPVAAAPVAVAAAPVAAAPGAVAAAPVAVAAAPVAAAPVAVAAAPAGVVRSYEGRVAYGVGYGYGGGCRDFRNNCGTLAYGGYCGRASVYGSCCSSCGFYKKK